MAVGGTLPTRDTAATASGLGSDPVVEALLRQLVEYLAASMPSRAAVPRSPPSRRLTLAVAAASDISPAVVLDVCLDDRRYTLLCARPEPLRASVTLSPREREIALLVARGLANKTIATILEISRWTVATYVRRLFDKLDVSSRAEMVARLYEDHLMAAMNVGLMAKADPTPLFARQDAARRDQVRPIRRPAPADEPGSTPAQADWPA